MNWWSIYPFIVLAIALGLHRVGAIRNGHGTVMFLVAWLWPLVVPLLVWHGISVIRWNRANASRRPARPDKP
mgnify:FL=1